MKWVNFVISICFLVSRNVESSSRIVKGEDAEDGEFPYAVSLRYQNSHICGGTILNDEFILTAAHCVCVNTNSSLYSIQYDLIEITTDQQNVIQVKNIICGDFDPEKLTNDVAILELKNSIPKGNWIKVPISKQFITTEKQNGIIIGWGKTSHNGTLSRKLQKLKVDIFDDKICGVKYNNEHHICFGAMEGGACNGDSGTALLVDGVQVGIASFITATCGIANEDNPNVYSRVATYYDWIKENTEKKSILSQWDSFNNIFGLF